MTEESAAQHFLRMVPPSAMTRAEQRLVNPKRRLQMIQLASGKDWQQLSGGILPQLQNL